MIRTRTAVVLFVVLALPLAALRVPAETLEKYKKDPAAAKALAKGGLTDPPKELDQAELAAWTVIANVLLNLDETITKG